MISNRKRRRQQEIEEHTPASLREVYKQVLDAEIAESDVTMEGKHTLLRWLVIACEKRNSSTVLKSGVFASMNSVLDKVEYQNAHYSQLTYDELMALEAEAASWAFQHKARRPVLTYLSFFLCGKEGFARSETAPRGKCSDIRRLLGSSKKALCDRLWSRTCGS